MSKEKRVRYLGGNRRTLYCAPNIELFPSLVNTPDKRLMHFRVHIQSFCASEQM